MESQTEIAANPGQSTSPSKRGTVPQGSSDVPRENLSLERDSPLFQQAARSAVHEPQITAVFAGRYRVTRTLHSSFGVETLLAVAEATSESVVIKAISLSAFTAGARLRLEHEQGVLDRIGNDCLASVREIGRGADCWYCVR